MQVGYYNPSNSLDMEDVKVANGVGYFADNMGSGLHIVNVSDPANPALLSRITSANGGFDNTHKIAVWQNFVFIPQNLVAPAIIKVFDVSNPSSPVLKTTFTSSDSKWVNDLTIQTTMAGSVRAYTAGWGGKGDIWDITNIATQAPVLLGSFSAGIDGSSAYATDDGNFLAYSRKTTDGTSEVKIWNITNPASAKVASTITMSAFGINAVAPHDPKIVGNLLYVSWFQAGTLIFDITDPSKPVLVGSYDTWPASPSPGQLDGNWGVYPFLGQDRVLMSDRNTGLYIVDATGVSSQPALYNLQLTPETVLAGNSATGTIYLVGLGSTGGTVVTTSSDNASAVTPGNVTIAANATTVTFTIPTTAVNSTTTANITSSLNGASNSAALTITSVPDYSITMGPSSLTIFPGQNGTFSGLATAFGGYNHPVTLSCTAPAPPTCSFFPTSVTPTATGAPFTLTVASTSTSSYGFNVQGTGSDSLKRVAPVTVNVSDFTLGAASPSALSLTPGSSSQFSLQVGAAGTFAALVDLSCTAPTPITCSFSPSGSVTPTAVTPITVTVSVGAPATVAPGTYALTISATSLGAPSPKTQTVSISVTDFAVSVSSPSQAVHAGQTADYTLNVAPVGGAFNGTIALSCAGAPATTVCSVTPGSITLGSNAASVNVTVSTIAPSSARSSLPTFLYAALLPLGALMFFAGPKRAARSLTVFFALTMLIACGGGNSASSPAPASPPKPGTPSGIYTLTITADANTLHHPTTLTLIVQ